MAVDRQMEIEDMLASIDEILEQAKSVPFSDKVMAVAERDHGDHKGDPAASSYGD